MICSLKWLISLLILALSGCSTYHTASVHPAQKSLAAAKAQYAHIHHGKIEYYRFGSGSPVVLIPGYATDISSWSREFLLELAKHHELIVPNNRNVGGSLVQSTRYESEDLADDTYQLIEQLHLKKPAVIGFSMGGMIAQQLAARHANQLGKLILINTAIAGDQSIRPTSSIEKAVLYMPSHQLGRYLVAIQLFFPSSWRLKMAYRLAVDRFQPDHYIDIDPEKMMPPQRQLVLHWATDNDTAKKLQKVRLPVLILNGKADAVIPPENSEILARTFQHATLIRYNEGGHAMMYQFPTPLANAIHAFILKQV